MPKVLFGVTVPMTARAFLLPQLKSMTRDGWEVHLACSPDEGFAQLANIDEFDLHSISMAREPRPLLDIVSFFQWLRLVRELRPDLVVASTPKAAFLALFAAKLLGVRARIYHVRGFRAEGLSGMKRRISTLTEKFTIDFASDVLCDSNSLRQALIRANCLKLNMGTVLGAGSCCGVDTEFFRSPTAEERYEARARLSFQQQDFVVGFVGRVSIDKGIHELLDAITKVRTINKSVKLVVVGPNEDSLNLPQRGAFDSSIVFTGGTDDVRSMFWAFDLAVLPSYREGFPISALEAQACSIPLVTTSATGCIDSQCPENQDLTVNTHDSRELAKKILMLSNSSELIRMKGALSRKWVTENFESEIVVMKQIGYLSDQISI